MRMHLFAFAAAIAATGGAAVAFAGETTTSTQGNSTATITQSGGGNTTRQVIRDGNSQTIIQRQGGSSATITQGGSDAAARLLDSCPADSDDGPCVDETDAASGVVTDTPSTIDEEDLATAVEPDSRAGAQRDTADSRHRGRDRRSNYEKRVERDLGIRINPSDDFRRLFLDKL